MKRAVKYRFYPTEEQAAELSRTFGRVRKVSSMVLDTRSRAWTVGRRRVAYAETSALLTEWRRSEELAFPGEVSSVPLRQALRQLNQACPAFFDLKRAKYPRFKSNKKSRAPARYTRSVLRWCDGQLTRAKTDQPPAIVGARPLPRDAEPSTATITPAAAGRWFVSLLCGDRTVLLCGDRIVVAAATTDEVGSDAGPTTARHDRDRNAVQTVLAAGLAVSAGGAGVRPQRKSLPDGAVGDETGSATERSVTVLSPEERKEVKRAGTSVDSEGRERGRAVRRA